MMSWQSRSAVSMRCVEKIMVFSLLLKFAQHLDHKLDIYGVEARKRLVQDQEIGVVQDGRDELNLLLHSLRKVGGFLGFPLG